MKIIGIILFIICLHQVKAQNHVAFINKTMEQALKKAAAEKKLLFVDSYATWCGPCKQMDKKVFTDPEVINYFDTNFINIKIDVDTEEGQAIAKKYYIDEVPTLLFMNAEGKIIRRLSGYYNGNQLIQQAQETLDMK